MKSTECQEDTGETRPLRVCQCVFMNVSSLQKLTRKMSVHTAPCSQLSKQMKPAEQLFRGLPAGPQISKDHIGPHDTANIVAGFHPDPGRMHHTVSHTSPSAPPHLEPAFPRSPYCCFPARQSSQFLISE